MFSDIKVWFLKNLVYILLLALIIIGVSFFLLSKKIERSQEDVRNAKEVIFSFDSVYESILSKLPKSNE